jgi:hypothetical protein
MKYMPLRVVAFAQIGIGLLALAIGLVTWAATVKRGGSISEGLGLGAGGFVLITLGALCFVAMDIEENTRPKV